MAIKFFQVDNKNVSEHIFSDNIYCITPEGKTFRMEKIRDLTVMDLREKIKNKNYLFVMVENVNEKDEPTEK